MDFCAGQNATVRKVPVTATESAVLSGLQNKGCGRVIYNDGGTLFVTYGPISKKDLFTVRLLADKEHLVQFYNGVISAIKLSGTSDVYVTEVW